MSSCVYCGQVALVAGCDGPVCPDCWEEGYGASSDTPETSSQTTETEMSDDLVKRLNQIALPECHQAADRIEQLAAINEELEAKLSEQEALLAKAVEALEGFIRLDEDYSPFGGELLQDRVERTWYNARTTLAELSSNIKGEK